MIKNYVIIIIKYCLIQIGKPIKQVMDLQHQQYQHQQQHQQQQQQKTRDSQRSHTDMQEYSWSQSSHTYYYSKFQLFEGNDEINQFYRYSVFVSKLEEELGEEWRAEAGILFQPYFYGEDVFMNLLAIWLQLHPMVNTVYDNPMATHPSNGTNGMGATSASGGNAKIKAPVFNNSFVEEFVTRMKRIFCENTGKDVGEFKINNTSIKTVCMGFFITANQIWTQMFRNQEKSVNKGFSLFKGVTKKIEESFQPLMVVTQKISNLFGRKKVKIDQSSYSSASKNQNMFEDCYLQFRRNVGLQKELERKMSEFCLEQEPLSTQNIKQKKKIVTKDQFKDSQSPMQKNMLGNIYSYITKFLNRKHPWQVASSFVTNILDISQKSMQDGTKVKVLKPAQDFYQKLVIGWLVLTKYKQPKTPISFQAYLSHIRLSFARAWKQKYFLPTKYFYERLIKHWNDIQKQTQIIKMTEKQILNSLINKIRESMREDWQRKIKIEKKGNANGNGNANRDRK